MCLSFKKVIMEKQTVLSVQFRLTCFWTHHLQRPTHFNKTVLSSFPGCLLISSPLISCWVCGKQRYTHLCTHLRTHTLTRTKTHTGNESGERLSATTSTWFSSCHFYVHSWILLLSAKTRKCCSVKVKPHTVYLPFRLKDHCDAPHYSLYACINFSLHLSIPRWAYTLPVALHSWLHSQLQEWTSAARPCSPTKQILLPYCICKLWQKCDKFKITFKQATLRFYWPKSVQTQTCRVQLRYQSNAKQGYNSVGSFITFIFILFWLLLFSFSLVLISFNRKFCSLVSCFCSS